MIRILIGKPGLDGHDKGAKTVAMALKVLHAFALEPEDRAGLRALCLGWPRRQLEAVESRFLGIGDTELPGARIAVERDRLRRATGPGERGGDGLLPGRCQRADPGRRIPPQPHQPGMLADFRRRARDSTPLDKTAPVAHGSGVAGQRPLEFEASHLAHGAVCAGSPPV